MGTALGNLCGELNICGGNSDQTGMIEVITKDLEEIKNNHLHDIREDIKRVEDNLKDNINKVENNLREDINRVENNLREDIKAIKTDMMEDFKQLRELIIN